MAVISLTDYRPSERFDNKPWTGATIEGATSQTGTYTTVESFTFPTADPDPTDPQERSFTTELITNQTWLKVVFFDADGDTETTTPIPLNPVLYATRRDVASRLGRDLTEAEEPQVDFLLYAGTYLTAAAVGKTVGDFVPPDVFRIVVADMAARALGTPVGATASREQLGEYSYSQSYRTDAPGMALWDLERQMLRLAVYGTLTASSRPDSLLTTFFPEPTT
jgi:hypothetical protein